MATRTTDSLVEQIHQLDLKLAERRQRVRGGIASLQALVRAKLGSPLMMIGAFGTGFIVGRSGAGQRSRSAGREEPRPETGLFERILVAIAVMRSWSPLLRVVAGWFERPAKAPLDDVGTAVPTPRPGELQPYYPSSSRDSPPATATQRCRQARSQTPRQ